MNKEATKSEFNKAAMFAAVKSEIKADVETQKNYKNQRKTVRLNGERTIDPYEAAWKCLSMRSELRLKHTVWYLLKHNFISLADDGSILSMDAEQIKNALEICAPKFYTDEYTHCYRWWEYFSEKISSVVRKWVKKYGKDGTN